MDEVYFEIDYEIEAAFDEYGDFPLQCAALLFDLLNFNSNIIIKNQYSIKPERAKALSQYLGKQNCFYEDPKTPEGNYCIWIKQNFQTNQELIRIFKLQGIYLTYIVPNKSFDWEGFLKNWKKDERYLLLSGQSSFICNVIDMDRILNLNFNTAVFSEEKIIHIMNEWEKAITNTAGSSKVRKTVEKMRSKHGNKYRVCLCFVQ